MSVLRIGDRTVYLVRGKGKSDTVNVCDANSRRGQYDWIIRVLKPTTISEDALSRFNEVRALVDWLKNQPDVVIQQQPETEESPATIVTPPVQTAYDASTDTWTQEAKWLVEHTLEQLAHEVMEFPYLHRREHSLHARLFAMLAGQPHFSRLVPLGKAGLLTQTIHKEWPETKPREARKRGNFDLAILAPEQLKTARLDEFLQGRLPAPIVIEIGLDYDAGHLAEDEEKLANSEVAYPYLVHFERERYPDPRVDRILF